MKGLPNFLYYLVLLIFLGLTVVLALVFTPREAVYLLAVFLTAQLILRLSPWEKFVPHLRTKKVDAAILIVMICALLYFAQWGNAQ